MAYTPPLPAGLVDAVGTEIHLGRGRVLLNYDDVPDYHAFVAPMDILFSLEDPTIKGYRVCRGPDGILAIHSIGLNPDDVHYNFIFTDAQAAQLLECFDALDAKPRDVYVEAIDSDSIEDTDS